MCGMRQGRVSYVAGCPSVMCQAMASESCDEQEEQASPEAIAPAPEAASILAQLSPASSDAAVIIDSTGSGEVQEAIPWRRGFLAQLLRRGRQLLKQPASSKEG